MFAQWLPTVSTCGLHDVFIRSMFSRTGREGGVLASARGTPAMDLIATDLIASDSQQSFAEPISLF